MKATTKSVAYWVATGLLVASIFSGGVAELMHRPETIDGMKLLGYPVYFVMIIGFWKLLASVALLAPGFPRVKEWAYAGIFFNMTGAAVSHFVCGSAAWHVAVMLGLTTLTVASWTLRPASRTLRSDPSRVRSRRVSAETYASSNATADATAHAGAFAPAGALAPRSAPVAR
jgi:hypothetical protein